MNYLAPSVLSADFSSLGNDIQAVVEAGVSVIHLDVMDGNFVSNISFGAPVIASVRKTTNALFDVHLMVDEPIRYIKQFKDAGADIITVHYEACSDIVETLTAIRQLDVKVGISICPDTAVDVLKPLLPMVDVVLIMSVYPGFGGQEFIPESLNRIRKTKELINQQANDIWLEVDGGVTKDNIYILKEAGANVFVAGTAVYEGNIEENVKMLHHQIH